jgi:hypothetical protein
MADIVEIAIAADAFKTLDAAVQADEFTDTFNG